MVDVLPDIHFEYDYVKVVYEFILSKLRMNKKIIEKEINVIVLKLGQVKKKITQDKVITPDIEKLFDTMVRKISELESKYLSLKEEEDCLYNCLEERLKDLKLLDFSNEKKSGKEVASQIKQFTEKKINNLLLEFLLREKYLNTAKSFIEEEKIKESVELSIYLEIQNLIASIKNKSLTEVLAWSTQNKNKLSKINSNIRFKIIKQQFIEMIKNCFEQIKQVNQTDKLSDQINLRSIDLNKTNYTRKTFGDIKVKLECIKFAKENFGTSELNKEELKELENLMLLLIVNWEDMDKFKDLNYMISEDRWLDLENEVKNAFFSVYSMKPYSSLEILFQCGLLALKNPLCKTSSNNFENNCPTCNPNIAELASSLPYSQHPVSSLLCRKTKKIMDHNNPPLATKLGYMFSSDYVNEQIKINNTFYCEEEKKFYKLDDLKKVYIV